MGGLSESACRNNLNKIREKMSKKGKDVKDKFVKIEKIKADLLKKTEEIRLNTEHEIDKIDVDVVKSKNLGPESKKKLHSEINILKREMKKKYIELKTRISKPMALL